MADLSSGLTTRVDTSQEPARLRVEWIDWASPFRGTAVGVGDTVLAVDGVPVDPLAGGGAAQRLPGGYAEAQAFEAAGRKVGDPLKLVVRRPLALGGTVSEVSAPLAEVSSARNADNQPILPPDGPVAMERDDQADNWGAWADQLRAKLTYLLDVERHTATFVSRFEAKELRERHGDRVALAVSRYPGAWSAAVKADYDAALKLLEGEAIVLPPGALDFRRRGEILAGEIRVLAQAAWDAAKGKVETVSPFPAVDPTVGQVAPLKGKTVVLPPLGNAQWVSDSNHGWFCAGSPQDGWYFIDAESPAAEAMLRARDRYGKIVDPGLAASFEFIATITGESRLVMIGERAWFGLVAAPVAALVGGAMFVDLSSAQPKFAGEEGLVDDTPDLPPDDAPPAAVLAALIGAVKAGDIALWRALHADWEVGVIDDADGAPRRIIYPHCSPPQDARFEDSRRSMAKRVADVRVAWVGEPVSITDGSAFPGAFRIDEVAAKLDHIGNDNGDGNYRVFADVTVSCDWRLQRVDGGPWRIATVQSI
jgi:hypothetical protein